MTVVVGEDGLAGETTNRRHSVHRDSGTPSFARPSLERDGGRPSLDRPDPGLRRSRSQPITRRARYAASRIVDNVVFVSFGIFLTIWALIGDDLRLIATNKPMDTSFDYIVVFCIVFFSVEVVISCLGNPDYFLSFFFFLDVLSTFTLFLDLTPVSNAIFDQQDTDNETDKARSSKTARAGARVGRVVRTLRLFRIVKLFKAAQWKKKKTKKEGGHPGSDDIRPGEEGIFAEEDEVRESHVGKQLSGRTTNHTIVVVLILLICLPLFSMDSSVQTPSSAEYGADDVMEVFLKLLNDNATADAYEAEMLKYVYFHNWFAGLDDEDRCSDKWCPNAYYSHLFWLGVGGAGADGVRERARLRSDKVQAFNDQARVQDDLFDFDIMPGETLAKLSAPWDTEFTVKGKTLYGVSLLGAKIPGVVDDVIQTPNDLRGLEVDRFAPRLLSTEQFEDLHFVFFFDLRPFTRDVSLNNILKTAFVCIVLCAWSLMFSRDANTLVLQPVELMINKVEAIRNDPLCARNIADDCFEKEESKKREQEEEQNGRKDLLQRLLDVSKTCSRREKTEMMETVILEKTIIKLGSLLALGLGEAGAKIVSHNMTGANSGGVDAMIEGSRVDCIIGHARICNFSVATEVLQAKVMTFVNQVAEIVHGVVDQFYGAVNKNNGDFFLVIWQTTGHPPEHVTKLAEMSLTALTRIVAEISKSSTLETYRYHPGLKQRLRSQCRVRLCFGLHSGWAFEGAVGSEFKIDASYLSPHVSIAASLERAARHYGVCIIVSDAVADLCTYEMKSNLRLIDKVILPESDDPLELYCMDLDYMSLDVEDQEPTLSSLTPRLCYNARRILAARKEQKWSHSKPLSRVFDGYKDIQIMRQRYSMQFSHIFNMGYQNYSQGEWQVAGTFLRRTERMLGVNDGPSGALLRFMEMHAFEAPAHWSGVRELVFSLDHQT